MKKYLLILTLLSCKWFFKSSEQDVIELNSKNDADMHSDLSAKPIQNNNLNAKEKLNSKEDILNLNEQHTNEIIIKNNDKIVSVPQINEKNFLNENVYSNLLEAISSENITKIKNIINNEKIYKKDENGKISLGIAVYNLIALKKYDPENEDAYIEKEKFMSFILNLANDLNTQDKNSGNTPVNIAIINKNFLLVKLLLKKNVDLKILNRDRRNSLHLICLSKNKLNVDSFYILEEITNKIGNLNQVDNDGNTALHLAKDNYIIEHLIKKGADVDILNKKHNLAVHFLLKENGELSKNSVNIDLILKMSKLEISDIKNEDNYTTFQLALKYIPDYILKGIISLLTSKTKDINLKDSEGNTVMHIASKLLYHSIILEIASIEKLNINAKNNNGESILTLMFQQLENNIKEIRKKEKSVLISQQKADVLTSKVLETVRSLKKIRPELDINEEFQNQTQLVKAIIKRDIRTIHTLKELGASINGAREYVHPNDAEIKNILFK